MGFSSFLKKLFENRKNTSGNTKAPEPSCPAETPCVESFPDKETITFKSAVWSCQGPRPNNEDALLTGKLNDGQAFAIVSDGIGGAPHGEVYSKLACHYAASALEKGCSCADAIDEAQEKCLELMDIIDRGNGCGATLLVTVFELDGSVHCAYVGDSRLLVVSPDGIQKWSVPDRKYGNALASAIGKKDSEVHTTDTLQMEPGSVAFLMTDGAWELLEKDEYAQQLQTRICEKNSEFDLAFWLSDTAGHEGSDNATVVVVSSGIADSIEDNSDRAED